MTRRLMGPVRQAALEAAVAAKNAANTTSDEAKKSIFSLTEKACVVLEKICDTVDDVAEGKVTFKVFGKKVPIEFNWDIKEDEK